MEWVFEFEFMEQDFLGGKHRLGQGKFQFMVIAKGKREIKYGQEPHVKLIL